VKKNIPIVIIVLISLLGALFNTLPSQTRTPYKTMESFQNDRFGIFIHWDPRVLTVPRLNKSYRKVDLKDIHNMYKYWNPINFNAEDWVKIFKKAGAKYIVFTTKHQYGFSNFDNPYTLYDVMETPFKRDVCKELADLCQNSDIKLYWYFASEDASKSNPGVLPLQQSKDYPEFRYNSVKHLLTHYGRIEGIWWDGGDSAGADLRKMILSTQPHIIMGPRIRMEGGNKPTWRTPEQIIGAFDMQPWESCVPLEGHEWFYCGGKDIKPTATVAKLLLQCAGGDGNLLLNTSPMPDGNLQPEQVETLLGVGQWLEKYGKTVYGTRGGPYKPGPWGAATRNGNKIYLHILQMNKAGTLELPGLPQTIEKYSILTKGQVTIQQSEKSIEIKMDAQAAQPRIATIIELTMSGDVMEIDAPIEMKKYQNSLTTDGKVTASSQLSIKKSPDAVVYHSDLEKFIPLMVKKFRMGKKGIPNDHIKVPEQTYSFELRERGFRHRYWMPAENDTTPWITVNLGESQTFDEVYIMEKYDRIKEFELQYFNKKGEWISFYQGGSVNYFCLKVKPITTRQVRLIIRESRGIPAIKMIDLF